MPDIKEDAALVQILVRQKLISAKQLQECQQLLRNLGEQGKTVSLIDVLLRQKYVTEEQLASAGSQLPARKELQSLAIPNSLLITRTITAGSPDSPNAVNKEVQALPDVHPSMAATQIFQSPEQQEGSKNFSRYQIIKELGHGGMGVVYESYDPNLKRHVALKIMHQLSAGEKEQRRFLRETELMAKLNHPHIIKIFDVGQEQQRLFFAMELVDGGNLDTMLKDNTPVMQIIRIIIQVAEALHYAHQQDVVHRDIKPSNIMINKLGEAKVMDFGLAKQTSAGDQLSKSQDILGTPEYMSPEQAAGKNRAVDAQTDVYSLGVILYQVITGRLPFTGNNPMTILYKISSEEPRPPSQIVPHISRDIEAICLKAMEKDKSKRYKTAGELAADLIRYREGEPVLAKPITTVARAWRWGRRHRFVAVAAIGSVLTLIGLALFFLYQQRQLATKALSLSRRVEKENKEIQIRLQNVERQKSIALQQQQAATLSLAEANLVMAKNLLAQQNYEAAEGKRKIATELLQQVRLALQENRWEQTADLERRTELLWQACAVMKDHCISFFSPRYELLTFPQHLVMLMPAQPSLTLAALYDPKLQRTIIWDIQRQKIIYKLEMDTNDCAAAFSSDNKWVALGDRKGNILIQDLASGEPRRLRFRLQSPLSVVHDLRFSPDNKWLFAATFDSIALWTFPNLEQKFEIERRQEWPASFSRNSQWLAVVNRDGPTAVFDLRNPQRIPEPSFSKFLLYAEVVCFGPTENTIICGLSSDIHFCPLSNEFLEDKLTMLAAHRGKFFDIAVSPDGNTMASVGQDGRLICWSLYNYQKLWEAAVPGNLYKRAKIQFCTGKKQIMLWSAEGVHVYSWDIKAYRTLDFSNRKEVRKLDAQMLANLRRLPLVRNRGYDAVNIAIDNSGDNIAVYCFPNLYMWNIRQDSLQYFASHRPFGEVCRYLAFDKNSELVMMARLSEAWLYRLQDAKLHLHIADVRKRLLQFNPHGGLVMASGESLGEMFTEFTDISPEMAVRQKLPPFFIMAMAFDKSGRLFGRYDGEVLEVWDIKAEPPRRLATQAISSSSAATVMIFAPGNRIAIGAENGDFLLCNWERQTCSKVPILSAIRKMWYEPQSKLFWLFTINGLYLYPDNEDEASKTLLNQIYPMPLWSGYPVFSCDISRDFRYLVLQMQSGESIVMEIPR